jgi:hypothetical protein
MKYYPKNKIKTDLYTNGDSLYTRGYYPYVGYYFETYDGKYFSGKNPSYDQSEELFTYPNYSLKDPSPENFQPQVSFTTYQKLPVDLSSPISQKLPYGVVSTPTQEDYANGRFMRYFVKKTNENVYISVDKNQYTKILTSDPNWASRYYTAIILPWVISNVTELEAAKINKNTTHQIQTDQRLYGFVKYIESRGGYNKFYK